MSFFKDVKSEVQAVSWWVEWVMRQNVGFEMVFETL